MENQYVLTNRKKKQSLTPVRAHRQFRLAALRRNGLTWSDSGSEDEFDGSLGTDINPEDDVLHGHVRSGEMERDLSYSVTMEERELDDVNKVWGSVAADGGIELDAKRGSRTAIDMDEVRKQRQNKRGQGRKVGEQLQRKQAEHTHEERERMLKELMHDKEEETSPLLHRRVRDDSMGVALHVPSNLNNLQPGSRFSQRSISDGGLNSSLKHSATSPPLTSYPSTGNASGKMRSNTFGEPNIPSDRAASPPLSPIVGCRTFVLPNVSITSKLPKYSSFRRAASTGGALDLLPSYATKRLPGSFLQPDDGAQPSIIPSTSSTNKAKKKTRPIGEIIPDFSEVHSSLGCHFLRRNIRPETLLSTVDYGPYVRHMKNTLAEEDQQTISSLASNVHNVLDEIHPHAPTQMRALKESMSSLTESVQSRRHRQEEQCLTNKQPSYQMGLSEDNPVPSHAVGISGFARFDSSVVRDDVGGKGKQVIGLDTLAIGAEHPLTIHLDSVLHSLPESGLRDVASASLLKNIPAKSLVHPFTSSDNEVTSVLSACRLNETTAITDPSRCSPPRMHKKSNITKSIKGDEDIVTAGNTEDSVYFRMKSEMPMEAERWETMRKAVVDIEKVPIPGDLSPATFRPIVSSHSDDNVSIRNEEEVCMAPGKSSQRQQEPFVIQHIQMQTRCFDLRSSERICSSPVGPEAPSESLLATSSLVAHIDAPCTFHSKDSGRSEVKNRNNDIMRRLVSAGYLSTNSSESFSISSSFELGDPVSTSIAEKRKGVGPLPPTFFDVLYRVASEESPKEQKEMRSNSVTSITEENSDVEDLREDVGEGTDDDTEKKETLEPPSTIGRKPFQQIIHPGVESRLKTSNGYSNFNTTCSRSVATTDVGSCLEDDTGLGLVQTDFRTENNFVRPSKCSEADHSSQNEFGISELFNGLIDIPTLDQQASSPTDQGNGRCALSRPRVPLSVMCRDDNGLSNSLNRIAENRQRQTYASVELKKVTLASFRSDSDVTDGVAVEELDFMQRTKRNRNNPEKKEICDDLSMPFEPHVSEHSTPLRHNASRWIPDSVSLLCENREYEVSTGKESTRSLQVEKRTGSVCRKLDKPEVNDARVGMSNPVDSLRGRPVTREPQGSGTSRHEEHDSDRQPPPDLPVKRLLLMPMIGNVLAGDETDLIFLDNYMYSTNDHNETQDAEMKEDNLQKERDDVKSTFNCASSFDGWEGRAEMGLATDSILFEDEDDIFESRVQLDHSVLLSESQAKTGASKKPPSVGTPVSLRRTSHSSTEVYPAARTISTSSLCSAEYDKNEDSFCAGNIFRVIETALRFVPKFEKISGRYSEMGDTNHVGTDGVTNGNAKKSSLTKSIKRALTHCWMEVENTSSTFGIDNCVPVDLYCSSSKDRCSVRGQKFTPPTLKRSDRLRRDTILVKLNNGNDEAMVAKE